MTELVTGIHSVVTMRSRTGLDRKLLDTRGQGRIPSLGLERQEQEEEIVGILSVEARRVAVNARQAHGYDLGGGGSIQRRAVEFPDVMAPSTGGPVGAEGDFIGFVAMAHEIAQAFRAAATGSAGDEALGEFENERVVSLDVVSEFVDCGGHVDDTRLEVNGCVATEAVGEGAVFVPSERTNPDFRTWKPIGRNDSLQKARRVADALVDRRIPGFKYDSKAPPGFVWDDENF